MNLSPNRKNSHPYLILFSFLLHGMAVSIFFFESARFILIEDYIYQIYLMILFSFLMTLAVVLLKCFFLKLLSVLILISSIFLISVPMGDLIMIEVFLLLNATIISVFIFRGFYSLLFFLFSLIGLIYSNKPVIVWGITIPDISFGQTLFIFFQGITFYIFSLLLKYNYTKISNLKAIENQLNSTVTKLSDSIIRFQEIAFNAEERSKVKECNRITKEIHDSIGYSLTTLIMLLEAACQLLKNSSAEVLDLIQMAKDQAKQGLTETRQSLYKLRDVNSTGLTGLRAVHKLITDFKKATGVDIIIEYGNASPVQNTEIDRLIYHIIQEGITNSFRHGRASKIKVIFHQNDKEILLSVHDNGNGSKNNIEGIGIKGMREQIDTVGGELKISSASDGFCLKAVIPYKEIIYNGQDTVTAGR